MKFDIALNSFRGFHRQAYIPIRPITVLVGENSSGKTSLLAAIKYLHDFLSGKIDPSFNDEPFQLGTFEQIAHSRNGRAGRAGEIRIGIRTDLSCEDYEKASEMHLAAQRKSIISFPGRDSSPVLRDGQMELTLSLANLDSNTILRAFEFRVRDSKLAAQAESGEIKWEYAAGREEPFDFSERMLSPRSFREISFRHIPKMLGNMHASLKREAVGGVAREANSDLRRLCLLLQDLIDTFSSGIVATSAIRTKPLRTYTPGIETEDGEGSSVPFELAKLAKKAKSKSGWEALRAQFDDFGKESGMYDKIDVKMFGCGESDPFQIQFSSNGPMRNMVDLGYGASQVLPILYHVAVSDRGSRFLIQQPEVHLHAKGQAALAHYFVKRFNEHDQHFVLETHSDFMLDRICRTISSGELRTDQVSLLFFERDRLENRIHHIEMDERGDPISPPNSYRAFIVQEQMRNLGL